MRRTNSLKPHGGRSPWFSSARFGSRGLLAGIIQEIQRRRIKLLPHQAAREDSAKFVVLTLVSLAAIVGVLLASGVIYCLRHRSHYRLKEKLSGPVGDPGPDATNAYQELCRQRMAVRTTERPEATHTSRVSSVSSQFSDGPMPSPSARSSTSSWSEEPVQPNMDISTGHMVLGESVQEKRSIHTALDGCDPAQHEGLLSVRTWPLRLPEQGGSSSPFAQLSASARGSYELKLTLGTLAAGICQDPSSVSWIQTNSHRSPDPSSQRSQAYMEDHLKNKNRLEKEWEALCAYQAEPNSSLVAQREENLPKNRCPAVLTYDHSRVRLKSENSHSSSDYINASPIMDHDPRKPAYIATQGPLPSTVADFWQMMQSEAGELGLDPQDGQGETRVEGCGRSQEPKRSPSGASDEHGSEELHN
ncbi:hypothetical protein MG293_006037 [Ovis ammon polii]|uniref:Tyrosine-protein phosphatase domain-containing protein n=1 Tax=Ovis ammon polii TaxID=230172 RepID=A0AAD4UA50_OVIAM|nr:hypothetical protein MG293_006037 [Ovis ammon polii]